MYWLQPRTKKKQKTLRQTNCADLW